MLLPIELDHALSGESTSFAQYSQPLLNLGVLKLLDLLELSELGVCR